MKSTSYNIIDDIPRLQWACRRGMLELDIFLGNYLREAYPTLSIENKTLFIQLLNYADPDILAYLLGEEQPHDLHLMGIIGAIRHHAQTRLSTTALKAIHGDDDSGNHHQ